jgi:septal ring factor EnvC (AmiA/AmiB activator)
MDKITLIIFVGLSGFMLFLFFYIINRDKITENKLAGLELSLEEINQEIFKLKKEIANLKQNSNLEEIEPIIEEIVDSVKKVEKKYLSKLNELEERMEILENSSKKKVFDFSNVNSQDEERIKTLYKNGYSIEEISRELRIPAGEIELVLKFSNLS